ncbi:hypothetical protein Tco_0831067, partial [Tanacetum coccineum]
YNRNFLKFKTSKDRYKDNGVSDPIGGLVFLVDLTGDEDPTDEDGDTRMGDSTGVSASLVERKEISRINWEALSEDILGATTQRDTRSYYLKRYWELLPKEILGAITQRDTGSYYPKRDWDVLWENEENLGNNISG